MTVQVRRPFSWKNIQAVIFDVDGTLFDYRAIRAIVARRIVAEVAQGRAPVQDLLIVWHFRRCREKLAIAESTAIGEMQFLLVANQLRVPVDRVRDVINRWMITETLAWLPRVAFDGTTEFFRLLRDHQIQIGVFSDYPVDDKLKALGLVADVARHAGDPDIGLLKPHPAGFIHVASLLAVEPQHSLIIGDRNDRDGAAARRGGFPFIRKTLGDTKCETEFASYRTLYQELEAH